MLRKTPLMTWGMVLALSLPAFGQFDALDELYGNGVHAYNGANYVEAYNEFTRAIENGSEDPRVYYYRGLSFLKLGRPQEAQHDFADGAKREMADSDRFYNVSKALERVQGRPRAMLERYRAAARLAAFHDREQARFERYERIRQNEPNVLLKTAPGEKSAAEEMPAEEADDKPAPAEKPEAEMTDDEAPPPAEADPFGGDKPAAEKPEAKEPADDPAPKDDAETSTTPGKKIPAGRLAKGLFGSLARGAMKTAAGQPAAGQAASAEKPADDAAAPAEKPASDDPFAN
ncbi:MAG TPA: hypothetical protein VHB99_03295 [Pirellulales bacterium]|nr:hypothetical protein [Pirellulales bacterium]